MPEKPAPLPDFTRWPSFPFEGDMRIKELADPVAVEPPRSGEDASDCVACNTPDDAYIWVSERWRVRAMDRPTGLPMVLILECRSHLDLGDLPNLLAAELGVMTVRLERAIRSLDGVARVHVNRWGDGSAHLHMWFLARPYGRLQLRGTFLSLWDDILPTIPEEQWRENLALVAAWLADFGGQANAEPAHIQWQSPLTFTVNASFSSDDLSITAESESAEGSTENVGGSRAEPASGSSAVVVEPAREAAGPTSDSEATDDVPRREGRPSSSFVATPPGDLDAQSGRPSSLSDLEKPRTGEASKTSDRGSGMTSGGLTMTAGRDAAPLIPHQPGGGSASGRELSNTEH